MSFGRVHGHGSRPLCARSDQNRRLLQACSWPASDATHMADIGVDASKIQLWVDPCVRVVGLLKRGRVRCLPPPEAPPVDRRFSTVKAATRILS